MIDVSLVSELSWIDLAESFMYGAREFYKDPKNKEAYRKWAEERRKKENNGDGNAETV